MATAKGDSVHPWYKGNHVWKVKGIAQLEKPVTYPDRQQGQVSYDPKILQLEAPTGCSALWFNYWISTTRAKDKMRYGGGPPVLEEHVLLELMKKAITTGMLSDDFLKQLAKEIKNKPEI